MQNEKGEKEFHFDTGIITVADIKGNLAISDEFAHQMLSVVHNYGDHAIRLQRMSEWLQPTLECIWADNEAVMFIAVYSDDSDQLIRGKAATDSGRFRPPIPIEGGHLFRVNPATP
ncbi:MAG: hypothetical protein ABSG91_13510, partial [Syntrophobacteraceae bacterium]